MPEVDLPVNVSADNLTENTASILVIDDEAGIRESLEVLLTLEGYTVTMAVDGEMGLRMIESGSFDLVLLDLALPVARDTFDRLDLVLFDHAILRRFADLASEQTGHVAHLQRRIH